MAEYASPAIEVVKLVGSTVWKYIKFQIAPNSYVTEFRSAKETLRLRLNDVDSDLQLQLSGVGKIPKEEVGAWLKKATNEIAKTDDDEFNKGGCFFNVCRAKHFAGRSQELRSLHEEGGTYAQAGLVLVRVDHEVMKNHLMSKFQKTYKNLELRKKDIESTLQAQIRFGKIAKEEVNGWLDNAGKILEAAQAEVSQGGSLSPPLLAELLEGIIHKLKYLLECGEKYIHAGVILVSVDHAVMMNHLMSEFQKTYGSLQLRKKDIESTLQAQIHFGKIAKEEVNGWLENAGKIIEAAQVEVSQSRCLSPPHVVGVLERKIQELEELLENGANYTIEGAILVHDDPSTIRGVPLYAEKCYGRDTALAEIPKILKGDQVTRIAVWGMGGIGKTTLMKQIHNQFLNEAEFDKVIWITVSSTLDIRRIQDEIAQKVDKVQLEENDATRRAGSVSALLRRGKYLLILDDVWEAFSDEDVGILADSAGLKLVLTTRAVDVARKMDCGEIIKLQPLSSEESLQLFQEKVGKVVLSDDGSIKPRLAATLKQIVEECDGLPLAIVTVASTMKGMSDDQYSWVKALKQLQKGVSVVGGDKDPKSILKFSYDRLKDTKVQHCFLYCALYPEDFEIQKEQLIEYWIEEGLTDEMDTRSEMICEGHEILRNLQDNCLLESVSNWYVKMHDLLRDMALDIMSKSPRFFVKAGVSKEELQKKEPWPENVEKVSLMENASTIKEIPLATMGMKYNMLTTLLMPGNSIVMVPESLFMQMPGLKILDLSKNEDLRSLPDSISDLKNLTTLLLRWCSILRRVPSLSKCQALTKLDLRWTGIEEVPEGMEMLVNLKYLNLSATYEGMLPKLFNLQHLITTDVNVRVEDVLTLRKLEYLEADLDRWGLEEMRIVLGFMQEQEQRLTSYTHQVAELSLKICVEYMTVMLHNNDGKPICGLHSKLGQDEKRDLKCVNRILQVQGHQALSLGNLVIERWRNLECVFGCGFNPLKTLEDLELLGLNSLTTVFDEKTLGLSSICSFFPLKRITIWNCPKLKNLFSSNLLRGYFQNLEYVSITFCKEMEEIISLPSEEEEAQIEEKLTLPKLKTLQLISLHKLKSIYSCSSSVLICDSLEYLKITYCGELNRIPLYFPQLDNAQPSSTLSLKIIIVNSEIWWRFSTEWCHPKDTLLPFCKFDYRLEEEAPAVLRAAEALLKLIGKTPSYQGPVAMNRWRNLIDSLIDTTTKDQP